MLPDVAFGHGIQNKLSHSGSQAGNLLACRSLLLLSQCIKVTHVWLVMGCVLLPVFTHPTDYCCSHYCSPFSTLPLLQDKACPLQYVPVGPISTEQHLD